ncbi:putative serine/threonine-protein kinase fhkC [Grifola frondosa]|uniref:Putative serine/threonine-protein kinase fhkC n=1 Tax=Grifola frondosa TaxID=5627 RepID=A0A1C7LNQ1_GRIFR|nr:putative serine/threonine-protein kinase fhkC [Grifola frondosa]
MPWRENSLDSHLWGFLAPCDSSRCRRIDFSYVKAIYTIGRDRNKHCVFEWDGIRSPQSVVTVLDVSSNGTYINGEMIGKNKTMLLKDGSEIAFSMYGTKDEDLMYRYLYRQCTTGRRSEKPDREYKLGKEIGRGAFATVFKAIHRTEHRLYAIKVIHKDRLNEVVAPDGASVYEREITNLERLTHPNICLLKEVFYERHKISLVMEFVAGGDLWKYMRDHKPLEEYKVQRIAYQIADAVSVSHLHISHMYKLMH